MSKTLAFALLASSAAGCLYNNGTLRGFNKTVYNPAVYETRRPGGEARWDRPGQMTAAPYKAVPAENGTKFLLRVNSRIEQPDDNTAACVVIEGGSRYERREIARFSKHMLSGEPITFSYASGLDGGCFRSAAGKARRANVVAKDLTDRFTSPFAE